MRPYGGPTAEDVAMAYDSLVDEVAALAEEAGGGEGSVPSMGDVRELESSLADLHRSAERLRIEASRVGFFGLP